jgi:hypothetical protein
VIKLITLQINFQSIKLNSLTHKLNKLHLKSIRKNKKINRVETGPDVEDFGTKRNGSDK